MFPSFLFTPRTDHALDQLTAVDPMSAVVRRAGSVYVEYRSNPVSNMLSILLVDDADRTAPIRLHELDHTDHTDLPWNI